MRFILVSILVIALIPSLLSAQEDEQSLPWEIMPGVTFVKLFPGAPFTVRQDANYVPGDFGWRTADEHSYAGTALRFTARCFTPEYPNLALTFGGGITWYYDPREHYVSVSPLDAGIGEQLWRQDFMVFPLSVGAQVVYPSRERESLMFYAGGEGNVNFINGEIMPGQQTKVGYTLLGGFIVKAFEFGVRYTAFSDMKNLGVHLGIRFNTFSL